MSDAAEAVDHRQARRWFTNSYLLAGTLLTTVTIAAALVGLIWTPYAPDSIDLLHRSQGMSALHPFGTDQFGRDVLSRVLAGGWRSLTLSAGATLLALALGIPLALAGAFWRAAFDQALMRIIDALLSIPSLVFALLIIVGAGSGELQAILALGMAAAPRFVRVIRGTALDAASQDYVLAAKARGEFALYIQYREILPNIWPPIIVEASIFAGFALMGGAALSYLGLGTQPPAADWGVMVRDAQRYLFQSWSPLIAPALTISAAIIGFNLLGEGLRDRLRGGPDDEL